MIACIFYLNKVFTITSTFLNRKKWQPKLKKMQHLLQLSRYVHFETMTCSSRYSIIHQLISDGSALECCCYSNILGAVL